MAILIINIVLLVLNLVYVVRAWGRIEDRSSRTALLNAFAAGWVALAVLGKLLSMWL